MVSFDIFMIALGIGVSWVVHLVHARTRAIDAEIVEFQHEAIVALKDAAAAQHNVIIEQNSVIQTLKDACVVRGAK